MRHNFYPNISNKRMILFAQKIFKIETDAFSSGNHDFFVKCYKLNDLIYAELRNRRAF